MKSNRLISIIIPCYNEADNIRETIECTHSVLKKAGEAHEILVVDDGSRDDSIQVTRKTAEQISEVVPVELMRNFGQTTAYQTGLQKARGSHILLFSGDLEIPAEQILAVIEQLDSGQDFVNTSRKNRWGGSHALKSKFANSILNRISGLKITDRGSGLKGMSNQVAKALHLYGEWHRFIPDLASLHTNRITEIEVPFEERKAGVSSYKGKLKSLSVFLDLATVTFVLFSQRKPYTLLPGRFFGFSGLLIGALGFGVSSYLVSLKLFYGEHLSNRPLFLVSTLTLTIGMIMVMIGLLGELIIQLHSRLDRQDSDQSNKERTPLPPKSQP